ALRLKTNPNTIQKVYYQLEVEGYIYSKPGSGYFVKMSKTIPEKEREKMFTTLTSEYLTKATELGYSINSIISEIDKRRNVEIETKGESDAED
ncbi:MAG: hypothetical protein JW737_08705, partial [Acidobacteria bacterium]|nr:hypothetical protein [Acidobacteriota bacterium]